MEHEVSLFAEFDLARLCGRARRFALFGGRAFESARLLVCCRRDAGGLPRGRCPRHRRQPVFLGTLAFDDPSVSDEAIVPLYSAINYPAPGGNVAENRIHWSFDRLLTPTLALTYDGGWIHQSWPTGKTSGTRHHQCRPQIRNLPRQPHEALVSVGVAWGIGQSGAPAVGADKPNTIQPGIFFGKGLATCPIGWPGRGLSPSPARSWMRYRPVQPAKPSAPIQRSANSKPTSCRR